MQHETHLSPAARYTKQAQYNTPTRATDKDGHLALPMSAVNLGKSPRSGSKAFNWVHDSSPRSAHSGSASKGKHGNQENYLTPEGRGGRDLCDASNFSRFQEIHNAPEKRALGPDSTEGRRKKHDYFDHENIKVPAFKLDFVDSEDEEYPAPVKEIRQDFAAFTSKIMDIQIGGGLLPASGSTMRV